VTKAFAVTTPDGRAIDGIVANPDATRTLVFHDGTPSSAVDFPDLAEAAWPFDLQVVSWSRPGYAGSSPRPGRTVADVVTDAQAVYSAVGAMTDYVVLGWSGGGPHALAHAALDNGRCLAAATIGGVAPYDGTGLDWLAGVAQENLAEFGAALDGEPALTELLNTFAAGLADIHADHLAKGLGDLAPDVDQAAVVGSFAEHLAAGMRAGLAGGVAGWRDDDLAFVSPWGFEPAEVAVPCSVWQGGRDMMVPPGHGERLAGEIPGAVLHLEPDEGHLSFVHRLPEILGDLVAAAGW
jgi:pimeloyl-ACP methyl ester carboxylesterase